MGHGKEPIVGLGADIASGDDAFGILVLCVPQTVLVETRKPPKGGNNHHQKLRQPELAAHNC
jgi:hypothetical protein